jgi:hypothetical protein
MRCPDRSRQKVLHVRLGREGANSHFPGLLMDFNAPPKTKSFCAPTTQPRRDAIFGYCRQIPAHEASRQDEARALHIAVSLKSSEMNLSPILKVEETRQESRDESAALESLAGDALSATHLLDHNSKINWHKRPLHSLMQSFCVARLPPCRSRRQ